MSHLLRTSNKGFSILIALGSIGVLMIIVIGMIQVFLTEMKLSRYQYDYILASEQAEGAFEYAMLKVANHRDGFADTMNESSIDQMLWSGATIRTQRASVSYMIQAQTGSYTKILAPSEYLILPLFVGNDTLLDSPNPSKRPTYSSQSTPSTNPTLTATSPGDIGWSIVAFDGDKGISLGGTGEISGLTRGKARMKGEECFNKIDGLRLPTCPSSLSSDPTTETFERIPYFYDKEGSVNDFLTANGEFGGASTINVKDPYIMIFNSGTTTNTITLRADTPFSLPELIVTTEAKKGNAVQRIRYTSDKSKYYDAIKYSVYNTP